MAALARASSLQRASSSLSRGASSGPLSDAVLLPPVARRGRGCCAARPGMASSSRSRAVVVRAEKDGMGALQRFVRRYDPVATGLGSLMVGAYCVVVHGQAPLEALEVSAFAAVLGMVGNELLFLGEEGGSGDGAA